MRIARRALSGGNATGRGNRRNLGLRAQSRRALRTRLAWAVSAHPEGRGDRVTRRGGGQRSESKRGGLRARQRLRANPGERGIGRALPTSLGDDDDCAVGGDCREAGRPCIRCLSPASTCRGVFGRGLRAAANCAELCGAESVSATIAATPRRGSGSAFALRFILTVVRELDVETSAATELACCGFAAGSHITHVQNCANLA